MNKALIFIIISIIKYAYAYSNGGPVDVVLFRKTGNIRLMNKADISLEKESLSLKIIDDFTDVKVNYVIKNNGNDETIIYGFPVDAYEGKKYGDYENENPFEWQSQRVINIVYFNAYANEEKLKIKNWVDDSLYTIKENQEVYQIYRKWYVVEIHFKKGETKKLDIEYKIENSKHDYVPGFAYIHRFSERNFTYHLFPSSNWGNGIVKDFFVNIDVSGLIRNSSNFKVEGMDSLEETNTGYQYKMENYDLKKSDRLSIHYNNSFHKLAAFINKNSVKDRIIKQIKTSSDHENAKNLIDNNPDTYWTGKVGDWFEIELKQVPCKYRRYKEYISVCGLLILNGAYSDRNSFNENGKIKSCFIVLNDTSIYNTEPCNAPEVKRNILIPQQDYIETEDKTGCATILADNQFLQGYYCQQNKKIITTKKIRVKITGISNGTKQNNAFAISELYLVGE